MDLLWTGASSNVSAVTQYQTIYLCTSPGCRWCPTVQNNIRKLSQLHLSSVRLKYSTTVRQLATFSLNNMSSVRWWPSLFTMNYIYSLLCRQNWGRGGRLATGDRDQYQVISSADLSPPALLHEWSLACVKYNPVYALISTQFICTILLLSSVDMDMKKVMLIRI